MQYLANTTHPIPFSLSPLVSLKSMDDLSSVQPVLSQGEGQGEGDEERDEDSDTEHEHSP